METAYEQWRDNAYTDIPRIYEADVKPQYDSNGYGTDLYIVFDELGTPVAEHIYLGKRGSKLVIGQLKGWDNETYDKDGYADGVYTEFGEVPFYDPTEEGWRLLAFLEDQDSRFENVEWIA